MSNSHSIANKNSAPDGKLGAQSIHQTYVAGVLGTSEKATSQAGI